MGAEMIVQSCMYASSDNFTLKLSTTLIYCKRGNFCVGGNFRIFHAFVLFAKINPMRK